MASAGVVAGGFVVFFLLLWLFIIGFAIFAFVFWIIMIVDVVQRNFKQENDKIMWILIIILTGIIGALIYYFMVKRKDKK